MGDFGIYFELGLRHIANLDAIDHILFLLALVSVFQFSDMKRIIILITAFTIGHTITLALATFDVVKVNSDIIEFLIPVTILLSALYNMVKGKAVAKQRIGFPFLLAAFFGLIHGLGFSNYLKTLLSSEQSVAGPLFGFNVGIELGQIIIVLIILVVAQLMFEVFRFKQRDWILVVSGICMGASLIIMKEAIFW